MEQYFYWNCFLDRKKENLHDAKRDSSDIDVLFTWACQDDISQNYNLWGRQFTIADALVAIWLIIAGVFMLRYFVKYQEMRRIFQKYSTEANEQYQSVLAESHRKKRLKRK